MKELDPEIFKRLINEPKYQFNPNQTLKLNLVNPFKDLYFKITVTGDEAVDLHSTFLVKVEIISFKPEVPCLVLLSEKNLEDMIILNKSSVLCDFEAFSKNVQEIQFEILPLKTGNLKIPEVIISPMDSNIE